MIRVKPFHCYFQNTTSKFLQIYLNKATIKERGKNYGCQKCLLLKRHSAHIAEKNVITKQKNKIAQLQGKQSYDRL